MCLHSNSVLEKKTKEYKKKHEGKEVTFYKVFDVLDGYLSSPIQHYTFSEAKRYRDQGKICKTKRIPWWRTDKVASIMIYGGCFHGLTKVKYINGRRRVTIPIKVKVRT